MFAQSSGGTSSGTGEYTMPITLVPVDAGPLTLFPGVKEVDSYWYVPKQPRIARDENKKPKMSFIKYVYNEKNASADEGLGGGVFHLVVGYDVTPEEIRDAQSELRRKNSRGKIVGPVLFKEGSVNISIPNITDPDKKEQIISFASAPVIEGANVAASFVMDKRNSTLLWESFNTPNPLVSINFNMSIAGYSAPLEARITIRTEEIMKSQKMQAGLATPWLSAEVGDFMDEMISKGAIKIEKIGTNFTMNAAIDRAIQSATELFFAPIGSAQGLSLQSLTGQGTQDQDYLTRASNLLNQSRTSAQEENNRRRQSNAAERTRATDANRQNRAENRTERERVNQANTQNSNTQPRPSGNTPNTANGQPATNNAGNATTQTAATTNGQTTSPPPSQQLDPNAPAGVAFPINKPPLVQNRPTPLETPIEAPVEKPVEEEAVSVPSIAIVASFVRKTVTRTIDKVMEFTEHQPVTIHHPFGGNLGVSKKDCPTCFIMVNLDDPLFKQRNILVMTDGVNTTDFDKFINAGSVQLRKKHEAGDFTFQEVAINRVNFNQQANLLPLIYGWKNDNDRAKWLDYEYKVNWNFFGGHTIEMPWTPSDKNQIVLSPPLQRKVIYLKAEKDVLKESNIRAIDVKVYYKLGDGKEQVKQLTINSTADVTSGQLEIMLPKETVKFEYEIAWRLWGNVEKKSGRLTTDSETLYLDELPK
jgi:dihydroxyacetone kinase DhaKLM complex PTS-EIIA-like component DhaM